jgi:hypothetical protein
MEEYRGRWKVMGAKDDAGVGEFQSGKKTRIAIACASCSPASSLLCGSSFIFFLVQYHLVKTQRV